MTDEELMVLLKGDSPLNQARRVLSNHAAHVEQAYAQRHPCSPVDVRKWEFETVKKIARLLGANVE